MSNELKVTIEQHAVEFQKLLPPSITPDRFIRTAQTALLRNPDLAQCSPKSIMESLLRCAGDGLMPDGREAVLNVFKGKAGATAQYMPMFSGLQKKARESGEIMSITTNVVMANDYFEIVQGDREEYIHKPALSNRGEIIGAYSIVRLKSGEISREWMNKEEIDKVRSCAKTSYVWDNWQSEMARKTVFRRHCKWLPLGTDFQRIIDVDNEHYDMGKKKATSVQEIMASIPALKPASALEAPKVIADISIEELKSKAESVKVDLTPDKDF
jgi:recombination protein RecT